jgi:hypothetical protein
MNLEQFVDQMPEERMVHIYTKAELIALKSAVQKKATIPALEPYTIEDIARELRQDAFNILVEKEFKKTSIRHFGFSIPSEAK